MGEIRFTTRLLARGPAVTVVLDEAQVAEVGDGAKRLPVVATVNEYTWRTSVARMGGEFVVGLNREVRKEAGVEAGQQVDVVLELDLAPRTVEVPDALVAALATDPRAETAFECLSFTHRKEYARWVSEAKHDETRRRRVKQALEMIKAGKHRS
jgi:antitoxin component of MazEF toxin-antitoxin module